MAMRELKAVCDTCSRDIADDEGGEVWVDHTVIAAYEKAVAEWHKQAEDKTPPGHVVLYSAQDIVNHPEPARWNVHHTACAPESIDNGYHIGTERLRTWADLTSWTAHLMAKAWLASTDWSEVLESASQGQPSRITPVHPPTLTG